jgi:hypothetical protein
MGLRLGMAVRLTISSRHHVLTLSHNGTARTGEEFQSYRVSIFSETPMRILTESFTLPVGGSGWRRPFDEREPGEHKTSKLKTT